jgi:hypothetical protein
MVQQLWARPLSWFAIILQYALIARYESDGDLVAAAIRFLLYRPLQRAGRAL